MRQPSSQAIDLGARHASEFLLDPSIAFLNHGSFGACPRPVMVARAALLEELEREPVQFFEGLDARLDEVRAVMGPLLGADPRGLAFVPNATAGVNAVLRSLPLREGDELLVTDHEYQACRNALDYVARERGARVVVVPIPFPLASGALVVERLVAAVTPRTRLALVDHVTSPTGLVLPIADIVRELEGRGVRVLVDGAHAPGMVPLSLDSLGASYFTGNFHKWLCAPKGAALLFVREDLRREVRPLALSHGATVFDEARGRFLTEFDWPGTYDPTPVLALPAAVRFLEGWGEGGIAGLARRNHALVLRGRDILCDALGVEPPAPDDLLGTLAAVPLPHGPAHELHARLFAEHRVEVPVPPWPAPPARLVRVSAQMYNHEAEYEQLARALRVLLPALG